MIKKRSDGRLKLVWTEDGVPLSEILKFLSDRIKHPIRIGDKIVFDFSNHTPNKEMLEKCVRESDKKVFYIPFSFSPLWGTMYSLLPLAIRDGNALAYFEYPSPRYAIVENQILEKCDIPAKEVRLELESLLVNIM